MERHLCVCSFWNSLPLLGESYENSGSYYGIHRWRDTQDADHPKIHPKLGQLDVLPKLWIWNWEIRYAQRLRVEAAVESWVLCPSSECSWAVVSRGTFAMVGSWLLFTSPYSLFFFWTWLSWFCELPNLVQIN